ncbi:MAG: hypothetical protein HXX09_05580 [Bacteroidetes bacterium]|nr:hypothetical protein [Bacteroidota bacterium]
MSKKTTKIVIVLAVLVVLVIIGLLSTGSFSGQKETELKENHIRKSVTLKCKLCHAELDSVRTKSPHEKVGCQDCHGVGEKHASNPLGHVLVKPGKREDCGECHSFAGVRKDKTTKHIDLEKHNNKGPCIGCHNPHSTGLMLGGSEMKSGDSRVCQMCHSNMLPVLAKGKHSSVACLACHGPADRHLKGPARGTIPKPSERSFCGKCHATGSAGGAKKIDLKEHNPDGKCIECHIAHNPLEFK